MSARFVAHNLTIVTLLVLVVLPGAAWAAAAGPPGTLDTTFDPGTGAAGAVLALALQPDGKVLAGGEFTHFNDIAHDNIVRLAADGSLDSTFNASVAGAGFAGVVSLARQPDGKIVIGGLFSEVNGVARASIARLKEDGTLDASFDPGGGVTDEYGYLNAVALQADGRILIGGAFSSYDSMPCSGIARITTTGAFDPTFDPGSGVDGEVAAVAIQPADGKVLLGGWFTTADGAPHNGIARLNMDGSVDDTFNPDVEGGVLAIAVQEDHKILIGGTFTTVNGSPRSQFARLNADGTLDPAFNPAAGAAGADEYLTAIKLQPDGKIVIGGRFQTINGVTRRRIARLLPDGDLDASFDPQSGANWTVQAIALQPNGRVLIGGAFDTVGGIARRGIARLWGDYRVYLPLVYGRTSS